MPAIRVTRRYRFSSSHRLHSPHLDARRNVEVYGKCNNPYGHGHDYTLDVTVQGQFESRSGRLIPLNALDAFVEQHIAGAFDRRDLNSDVADFAALVPTTENLAHVIAHRLAAFAAPHARVEKVRIWETPRNIIEVLVPSGPEQV
jgi:6-pyruvoyltetrahydropterin/6-carboxytetrahydropterin synthase